MSLISAAAFIAWASSNIPLRCQSPPPPPFMDLRAVDSANPWKRVSFIVFFTLLKLGVKRSLRGPSAASYPRGKY